MCHQVQSGVYHRVCAGVCLRASRELVREHMVKQAGCVAWSTSGSILGSIPRSVLENKLRGVLGTVLRVYFGVS